MPSLRSLGNAWWQDWAKQSLGKSHGCQCLRLTSAVAFVPLVPSVPSIVAGCSLKVRRTLNFRKLSPTKHKPFAAGKGHKGPKRQKRHKGQKGHKGQKRRHWGNASRLYWHWRQKGQASLARSPLHCPSLSSPVQAWREAPLKLRRFSPLCPFGPLPLANRFLVLSHSFARRALCAISSAESEIFFFSAIFFHWPYARSSLCKFAFDPMK